MFRIGMLENTTPSLANVARDCVLLQMPPTSDIAQLTPERGGVIEGGGHFDKELVAMPLRTGGAQENTPILVVPVRVADEGIKYQVTDHENGRVPAWLPLGKEFFDHAHDVLKGMIGLAADFSVS